MLNAATKAVVTKKCTLLRKFVNELIFEMNETGISRQDLIDSFETILLYVDEIKEAVNN